MFNNIYRLPTFYQNQLKIKFSKFYGRTISIASKWHPTTDKTTTTTPPPITKWRWQCADVLNGIVPDNLDVKWNRLQAQFRIKNNRKLSECVCIIEFWMRSMKRRRRRGKRKQQDIPCLLDKSHYEYFIIR